MAEKRYTVAEIRDGVVYYKTEYGWTSDEKDIHILFVSKEQCEAIVRYNPCNRFIIPLELLK